MGEVSRLPADLAVFTMDNPCQPHYYGRTLFSQWRKSMPAGNVFKPRRSLTRQTNPISKVGREANTVPGRKSVYQNDTPMFFQGVDQRTGQMTSSPITPRQASTFNNPFMDNDINPQDGYIAPVGNPMQLAGGPYSFNPQNQDVLARAAAALRAIEQDRLSPMQGWADRERAVTRGIGILTPNQVGQGWRQSQQDWVAAERGATRGWGEQPNAPDPLQLLGNNPMSFNPQNQDVLARAAAALQAIEQDRLNPMYGGQQGYAPEGRGPIPRSVASQAPNYYQQQAAGMDVEALRMRGLAGQIDALRQRSQQDNPMRPVQGGDPQIAAMQAEIDRGTRQGNIMFEPGVGSSLGATRNFRKIQPEDLNGMTAGTVNGYNGNTEYARNPLRLDPEEKFNLAKGNARRVVGGGAAADPTNIGGRFGGEYGAGLNADATAIREGRAVRTADGNVVYHTGTPESARQAYLSARANGYGRTPEQEAARHAKAVEQAKARAAKHQAFKDANGGMNYRQYDRMTGGSNGNNALTMKAVREGRLSPEEANYRMQIRAEKALRRAGNPITGGTSLAGQLFPDMTKGRGGSSTAQNPMQAGNPFNLGQGGMTTPEGAVAGRNYLKVAISGGKGPDGSEVPPNAFLAATGATGEEDNIQAIHFGIQQQVQNNKMPSPDDLKALHLATQAMQAAHGTPNYDPFDMTYGMEAEGLFGSVDAAHTEVFGPLYKELAAMQNPTPEALATWWGKFKSNIRPDTNRFIGGFSILSGEGAPTVSPGGYEYPVRPPQPKAPFVPGRPSVNPS